MAFGLLIGLSATIKPQAILFLLVAPAIYLISSESRTTTLKKPYDSIRAFFSAAFGASIPVLGMVLWLISKGSLAAFWMTLTTVIPLHARLGKHSFLYLISRCLTASHATILILAVGLASIASRDPHTSFERIRLRFLLVCGMAYGFISYMGQVKAYPYHRSFCGVPLFVRCARIYICSQRGRNKANSRRWRHNFWTDSLDSLHASFSAR